MTACNDDLCFDIKCKGGCGGDVTARAWELLAEIEAHRGEQETLPHDHRTGLLIRSDRVEPLVRALLAEIEAAEARTARLAEVVQDFLRSEYPQGTDHPADHEAARLARALAAALSLSDGKGDA